MSESSLKSSLLKLGAFTVAVVIIIIGLTVNLETIKGWVAGHKIDVTSPDRGLARVFFAGEKLRFSLRDIRSPTVIWVFDDETAIIGDVEIEYTFPYSQDIPNAQATDRRIDAFFKSGDSYEVASALVQTRNIEFSARTEIDEREIALLAMQMFDKTWALTGVTLTRYEHGIFNPSAELPPADVDSGFMSFLISEGAARAVLGENRILT